ncbi:MAG: peptide deformylase [Candidatus Blackburnbacteria bacterium RIFCSPHIGHO2_01_FULL_43_15b]|uniref:Peptide deformylase n=1 Tax=Candidatus Blackburnbacteria bacterium RIFCSPHIGHO2_01_FULL_43_15b TaxID=1797513 RepID=A0A1G1UYJ0_9BACT|nr:MAG: peptide deformylase [Candidatus Blackburnbacteria bacterium RIFCSPHIGHO2_01_FULL_43_15b]
MVRKILQTTDPKLREKSKPILKADKKLLSLIRDLEETLKAQNDPEGLGLAAPQIGEFRRVFILVHPKTQETQVFINPEILQLSEQTNDVKKQMEGCLSLPHYYGPVRRAESVKLKYQAPQLENGNWKMENHCKTFKGFLAHIIQHEVDHLNGIVFVDRLLAQNRKLFQLKGKEWTEVELV